MTNRQECPVAIPLAMSMVVPILENGATLTTYGIDVKCADGLFHTRKIVVYGDEKLADRIYQLLEKHGMEDTI